MAYREFRNEAYYKAPEIDQLMPQTMAALDTAVKIKAQKDAQQRSIQDNFKVANQFGYFPQNQERINQNTAMLVEMMNQWKRAGKNGVPAEAETLKAQIEADANEGKALWEALKQKEESVKNLSANNPYYKSGDDLKLIERAYDPKLTLPEIKQLLSGLNPGGRKLTSFNESKYLDDFVKQRGEKQTGSDVTYKSGVQIASEYKGRFFNEKGVPEITDKHIEEVLNTNPEAKQYYQEAIGEDINKELEQIVAGRFEEIPQTKEGYALRNMIDNGDMDVAANYLREHPELNPINQKTEFERISEKVKPALKQREDVLSKTKSDYSKRIPNSKYGSGSINTTEATEGFKGGQNRVVYMKSGQGDNKLIQFPVSYSKAVDPITGQEVEGGTGDVWGIVKDYGIKPVINGKPLVSQAKSVNELEAELKKLPLIERLKLTAQPVLNMKTVDKQNVLDIAYNQGKLNELEAQAAQNPDSEIAQNLPAIQQNLEALQAGEGYDAQLLQKFLGGDIVKNLLVPVNEGDMNQAGYAAITGIEITNPNSYSPEMKKVADVITKIKEEAVKENNKLQTVENLKAANQANEKELSKGSKSRSTQIIISNGDDIDTWNTNNVYKVGKNEYFYDKSAKEWKKR